MAPQPRPVEERFWEKVDKTEGCWNWTAGAESIGYGKFGVKIDGKNVVVRTHRFSWELAFGPIPDGLCVCHHCDNRLCVRPSHLAHLGQHPLRTKT